MENLTPEQLRQHIDAGEQVFLKLWKKGCGACKLSIPALERIEEADTRGLRFVQISVDDHPEMLEISETEVLPAFFLFKDKQMAGSVVGFKGIKTLQDFLAKTFPGS
jgi:thioredoxin-like negative regulator of GroEL